MYDKAGKLKKMKHEQQKENEAEQVKKSLSTTKLKQVTYQFYLTGPRNQRS